MYLDEIEMLNTLGAQNEVLNVQQRLKLKHSIVRNKSKLRMGAKRAQHRVASTDVLKKRAMALAHKLILKRILKNKDKSELSYSERQSYEKMIARKKASIERLAMKLLPKLRKLDAQRRMGVAHSLNLTTAGGNKTVVATVPHKPVANPSMAHKSPYNNTTKKHGA